jgi:hypothetical protein
MKLKIKVTAGNATRVVETSLGTIVQWERKYKKRAGDLAAGFAVEDLAFLAWASMKREGGQVADFDTWVDQLDDLEVVDSEESHPTDGAVTGGN